MTLEENIKAILECNFAIAREEVIEATTQRIMEQISRQNPLEEELEKIKAHFEELANDEWNIQVGADKGLECAIEVIEDRISELKGETDKEYEAKVITRGNCMMCGKELTEGLFLCKECGEKANKEREK